jgi:uncharacterized protein with PIN domain
MAIEDSIAEVLSKIIHKNLELLTEHDICPRCLNKLLGFKRKLDSGEYEYSNRIIV